MSGIDVKTLALAKAMGGNGAVIAPATASVGQTIIVKSVDENGKPTEWEAVDMAQGGGGTNTPFFVKMTYTGPAQLSDSTKIGYDYRVETTLSEVLQAVRTNRPLILGLTDAYEGITEEELSYYMYLVTPDTVIVFPTQDSIDISIPLNGLFGSGMGNDASRLIFSGDRVLYGETINAHVEKGTYCSYIHAGSCEKVNDAVGETPTASEFNALLDALKRSGLMNYY